MQVVFEKRIEDYAVYSLYTNSGALIATLYGPRAAAICDLYGRLHHEADPLKFFECLEETETPRTYLYKRQEIEQ